MLLLDRMTNGSPTIDAPRRVVISTRIVRYGTDATAAIGAAPVAALLP